MSAPYPAETNDGVVTSWVPLTTSFSSVQGCSNSFMLEGARLVAFDPGYGLSVDTNARCLPPAVTTWWNQGALGGGSGEGHTAVSILPLTCPDEWSTVATSTLSSSTTQIMCCPPGYSLANSDSAASGVNGDCLSDVLAGDTITYASTSTANSLNWEITSTSLERDSSVGAIAIVGWNVQLPVATSDTSASTTQPTTAPVTSSSTSAYPSNTSASNNDGENGTLSVGAKVGIGIGAAAAVIAICGLVLWIVLLKRKKNKAQDHEPDRVMSQPYYLDPDANNNPYKVREIDGQEVWRGPARTAPAELAASVTPRMR